MTSHHYSKSATPDPTKRYASDLNDQEFALLAPHVAQKEGSGKKRTVDIRLYKEPTRQSQCTKRRHDGRRTK